MGSILTFMLPAFFMCLVIIGIHSYLGIHVIKRKVIFVDLAFAQIAALGTLIALLFGISPHTKSAYFFALFLTVIGAAVFSLCRFRRSKIPQEAVIGLVYVIAAATAILLIDKAPHGAEHVKEILTGSILLVKWNFILLTAAVYAVLGLFHYTFRKKFLLISEDPDAAWDAGLNVRAWDFLFYLSFGLVITLSVAVGGVLIVFVFLVAPAILAIVITDELSRQLLVGWAVGLVVTTTGLVLAYVCDLSTGPAVIAVYGVTMILVGVAVYVLRAPRPAVALRNAGLVTAGFALAGALLVLAGTWLGGRQGDGVLHAVSAHERDAAPADDPGSRAEAIAKALKEDGAAGALIALRFLKSNPPSFFRGQVIAKLEEVMGTDAGFAQAEAPESPANRRASDRVRDHFGLDPPTGRQEGRR